jgi:two-component system response regulator FixJ
MNNTQTVFVVDDDPSARDSVIELVGSMGIPAEAFASAEEFLQLYEEDRPGCLVTDVRMLNMSGVELLERLADNGSVLPVIVITAFADVPLTVRAMRAGAVTLLEKPCRDQELWESVREALRRDSERRSQFQRVRDIRLRLDSLSDEERQVMELMVTGKANKVIADELVMGLRTVELRRHHLFRKMKADSVAELVELVVEARQTTP